MRKILLTTMLCLVSFSMTYSQEDCKMCGDWIGIFEGTKPHPTEDRLIPADYKLYIRIKKIDTNLIVRIKYSLADNSTGFSYMNEWKVFDFSEKKITLKWDSGIDDNAGQGWGIKNGKKCAYRRDVICASIELQQGVLYFDGGQNNVTWYDSNNNIISANAFPNNIPAKNVTLYKEENDW